MDLENNMRQSDLLIRGMAIELASYRLAIKENRPFEAVLMLQRIAEDAERLIALNAKETVIEYRTDERE